MDPKKQNLTPELKQIYDRVMNTQVKKPDAAPAPGTTTTPPVPGTTPPTSPSPSSMPAAAAPAQPSPANPVAQPASTGHDPFLSSAPPRPLTEDKNFVFSGNKITTPHGTTDTHVAAVGGKKLSVPILAAAVVIGILVWAGIWAKVFGLV